jgi:hypothetical protein
MGKSAVKDEALTSVDVVYRKTGETVSAGNHKTD